LQHYVLVQTGVMFSDGNADTSSGWLMLACLEVMVTVHAFFALFFLHLFVSSSESHNAFCPGTVMLS
jgi:hypothetical protein